MVEPSPRWPKEEHQLAGVDALLKIGFARLRARADALEIAVKAAHADLVAAREPIVQDMLENLAAELAVRERQASELRARLRGLSYCSNGSVPQKLPWLARDLLGNPPRNVTPVMINTPEQRAVDHDKQAFRDWKQALESDAQTVLSLD